MISESLHLVIPADRDPGEGFDVSATFWSQMKLRAAGHTVGKFLIMHTSYYKDILLRLENQVLEVWETHS